LASGTPDAAAAGAAADADAPGAAAADATVAADAAGVAGADLAGAEACDKSVLTEMEHAAKDAANTPVVREVTGRRCKAFIGPKAVFNGRNFNRGSRSFVEGSRSYTR
jgi:hypothetical protein